MCRRWSRDRSHAIDRDDAAVLAERRHDARPHDAAPIGNPHDIVHFDPLHARMMQLRVTQRNRTTLDQRRFDIEAAYRRTIVALHQASSWSSAMRRQPLSSNAW